MVLDTVQGRSGLLLEGVDKLNNENQSTFSLGKTWKTHDERKL